jgi:hypothetical protein
MCLFRALKNCPGVQVQAVVYDMLMNGKARQEVMHHGVIPIVPMTQADDAQPYLPVPVELPSDWHSSTARPIAAGGAAQAKRPRKTRYQLHQLDVVTHDGRRGPCCHVLWALDGTIITCPADETPSVNHPHVPLIHRRFEDDGNHRALVGEYEVPCRHGPFRHRFDLSGTRPGGRTGSAALADWLLAVPDTGELSDIGGWRSDAESLVSTAKYYLPRHGRANRLDPDRFLLHLVGFALYVNSTAWDVHCAQHTNNGAKLWAAANRRASKR